MENNKPDIKRTFFDPSKMAMVFHPGETLEEKLSEMGMGIKEFATRVSKPEKTIIAVIQGKSSVTPDMAVAFEKVTKIPVSMWLRHQKHYDEFIARKKREKILKEGTKWAKEFPINEMKTLGWIPEETPSGLSLVDILCDFFAVSSPKGWEELYLNQRLRVSFRINLSESCNPYAVSAWLRQGEIQAGQIQLNTKYSSAKLRKLLPQLIELKGSADKEVYQQLTDTLAEVGVKLVLTPNLKDAPIKGCVRHLYGYPCIQLSSELDSETELWETLFHELGHLLLHGKKEIFIENVNIGNLNPEKEAEAERFVAQWL